MGEGEQKSFAEKMMMLGTVERAIEWERFDLLEGIASMAVGDQAMLAAMLRETHLLNLKSGEKAFGKRIEDARSHFSMISAESRCEFIINGLMERLGVSGSRGHVGCQLLRTVARRRTISANQDALQASREVATYFITRMTRELKRKWDTATPEQRRKMDEALGLEIDKLSEKEKAGLREGLKLTDLTGAGVRQALLSGGAIAVIAGANAAGFGAYLALTTSLHFIFTTVLGITLPFAAYTFASSALAVLLTWTTPIVVVIASGKLLELSRTLNADLLEMACVMAAMAHPAVNGGGDDEAASMPTWALEEIRRIDGEIRAIAADADEVQAKARAFAVAEEECHRLSARRLAAEKRKALAIEAYKATPAAPTSSESEDIVAALQLAEEAEAKRLNEQRLRLEEVSRHEREEAEWSRRVEIAEEQLEQRRKELDSMRAAHRRRGTKVRGDINGLIGRLTPSVAFHRRAVDWLVDHYEVQLVVSALLSIKQIASGDIRKADHGKMTSGYRHIAFDGAHRIYYTIKDGLQVILIGDKNSQNADENWLRSQPAIEA